MVTLSETLQAAMAAGNPQRALIEFPDQPDPDNPNQCVFFSNEEISMTSGISWDANFNGETELTVGLCPSAEIGFTLLNDERQLSDFTFGECSVWIGYRIDEGTPPVGAKTHTFTEDGVQRLYEFIPLGVFIIDRPDIVQKDTIQVRGNDRMGKFDEEMPSQADLGMSTMPTGGWSILDLLEALCTKAGVTLATQTFLNSDLKFTSWPKRYFENRTMREVLKWIAEAAGSMARFNRQGQLEICWFQTVEQTYDEHSYSEFQMSWYETAAIDGLKVRNQEETQESTEGNNPENPYVIAGNPFLR